jgi:hypothetical protein
LTAADLFTQAFVASADNVSNSRKGTMYLANKYRRSGTDSGQACRAMRTATGLATSLNGRNTATSSRPALAHDQPIKQ